MISQVRDEVRKVTKNIDCEDEKYIYGTDIFDVGTVVPWIKYKHKVKLTRFDKEKKQWTETFFGKVL